MVDLTASSLVGWLYVSFTGNSQKTQGLVSTHQHMASFSWHFLSPSCLVRQVHHHVLPVPHGLFVKNNEGMIIPDRLLKHQHKPALF